MRPADNFQVVDGWIESKEKKDGFVQGNAHYELYRMIARITAVFDETRFPRDDHLLTICIEDPSYIRQKMVFEADTANVAVSSPCEGTRLPDIQGLCGRETAFL